MIRRVRVFLILIGVLVAGIGGWNCTKPGPKTRNSQARVHTEAVQPTPPRGTATITGSVALNGEPIFPQLQSLIWLDPHRPGRVITLDSLEVAPDGTFRAERVPAGTVRLAVSTGLMPLTLPAGCSAIKELHVHAQETYDVQIAFTTSVNAVTFELRDNDARQLRGGELVASVADGDCFYGAHPFWRHRNSNVLDPRVFAFQGLSSQGLATASLMTAEKTAYGTVYQGALTGNTRRFLIDAAAPGIVTGTISHAGRDTMVALFPGAYRWAGHGMFEADQRLLGAPTLHIQSGGFLFDCVAPGAYTLIAETLAPTGEAEGLDYFYVEMPIEVRATPLMVSVTFPE